MFEALGIPPQALFGQLLIGLINGAFYAMLSLGLALIFGLLNIINFAHGAQYMMGAFVAWLLLSQLGIGYWPALLLAPLIVGLFGMATERLLLRRLTKLDPIYGLLLTFGLALVIEGIFRQIFGVSGQPYAPPASLKGGYNLGFMFLPQVSGLGYSCLADLVPRHLADHREDQARRIPARCHGESHPGAGVRHQCAVDGDGNLRLRRRAGGVRGRACRADLLAEPADGLAPDHRRLRRRGDRRHGLDLRLDRHRFRAWASSRV